LNTFDDDNEVGLFEEPRRRPPRDRSRRPQGRGPRRPAPRADGSQHALRLAGLVAIALLIVFGIVLSCGSDSKAGYQSYLTAMQPLAQSSADVGDELARTLSTPGLTAAAFQADLTNWSKQELGYVAAAQRLQPPGPLQNANEMAIATFQLRADGLANLASTITLAQQRHETPSAAAAALAVNAQALSASDTLWEMRFKTPVTQTLTSRNVTAVIVPPSKFVKSPDVLTAHSLRILYQRVGTPANGGHISGVHGSALIATNVIENGVTRPLSTAAGTTVTCCGSLEIDVVFQNSGNYPEVQVPVTVTIKVGDSTVYTHEETVAQIGKGEQKTVPFPSVNLPPKGFSHQATITVNIAKVKGEARLDNNEASYPVLFRLSTG
jgi:hypothetical protein